MRDFARLHTQAFNDQYAYQGPLGMCYSPDHTTFRLWAPTASRVQVSLGQGQKWLLDLQADSRHPGLWFLDLQGNFYLQDYSYLLTFPDGSVHETPDPYAVAARANGKPSVILDPLAISPPGWSEDNWPGPIDQGQLAICEIHIRDLTIGPDKGIFHKGKFLGLTEPDTQTDQGHLTGLAYLKSLGVSHIQIMPCFDFASVDEAGDLSFNAQYNWGYDPENYNVVEGSYASQPDDPYCRILEFKTLVQTLHQAGFQVIMDVVYNHVYKLEESPLHLTVPGYYFRVQDNGVFYDGTGCGNETASEQIMFRKYMIDSLCYWAQTYHIDGFRFDLMGIHDVETMQAVRQALEAINPHILLLGEGWQMGHHPSGVLGANQSQAKKLPGFRFFNDQMRDALRGSNFGHQAKGWINGDTSLEKTQQVYQNILGQPDHGSYLDASQSVIYTECHDNATLYDKLVQTLPGISQEEAVKRQALALSIQCFSFGTLFFHVGQEMLRTKGGDSNSYQSPDSINALDYDRAGQYPALGQLFRRLLEMRSAMGVFSLTSYQEIAQAVELYRLEEGCIAYKLKYRGQVYLVAQNARTSPWQLDLPAGEWQPLLAQWTLPEEPGQAFSPVRDQLAVEGLESILVQQIA